MIALPMFRGCLGAGLSYRTEVMRDSPVAYWRLGESSGTTAANEMGSYPGTYVGSPTLGAAGAVVGNNAATFNGTTQYATVAHESALSNNQSAGFSIECWVNPATIAGNDTFSSTNPRFIVLKGNNVSVANYFLRMLGGKINFGFRNSANSGYVERITDSAVVSTGSWQHIVATNNGSEIVLYLNGAAIASSLLGSMSNALTNTETLNISTGVGLRLFQGSIDEIAIYNTALSAERIAAHYAARNIPETVDSAIEAFRAASGATDTYILNDLVKYLKAQSLWNDVRIFPFKSAQNKGSGTTVYGLGGWTSNNITTYGGPTWGSTGMAFDAVDDRGAVDMTGINALNELYTFDVQRPQAESLADTPRLGMIAVRVTSSQYFQGLANGTSFLSGETISINLTNGTDNRRLGSFQTWGAGDKTQFVTRAAQTGSAIWRSKSTTTPITSGTQDFRPSQSGTASQTLIVNASYNGTAYELFAATIRVALLLCKTSLTQTQRETITDYLDAL